MSPSNAERRVAAEAPRRDAELTRRRLIESARHRFARDGYAATTVRDIAADAGVNVALINRYFRSKDGLFEACIVRTVQDLTRPDAEDVSPTGSIDGIAQTITGYIAAPPDGQHQLQLLLLLRSSGDERADRIRRDTLASFARGMADASGAGREGLRRGELELRAQIALSAALGILLLRSSTGLEPLTSASESELAAPVQELFAALLRVTPAEAELPDRR